MFKITPVQTKEEQLSITQALQIPYVGEAMAYKMIDLESEELLGFSQFEICSGYGILHSLTEPLGKSDFEAMFILGRQTMNFMDLCGVHRSVAVADSAPERLLLAIGYKKCENSGYECDMSGMFDGHCSGHAVKLPE